MTRPRKWGLAAALAVGYVVLMGAAGISLSEGVVRPGRVPVTGADRQAAWRLATTRGGRLEDVEIRGRDGVRLRGWLFTPIGAHAGSAIVLHGQGSNRAGMLPYVDLLLSAGLTVLAPDARAHGDSGGAIASYGVVEAADVRAWADLLRTRTGGPCVYGLAESMGAGTLLQALDANGTFCAVAVESPFASFREVAYDRIGSVFHAGPWLARTVLRPVVESGTIYVRTRYGIDLDRANPVGVVARTSVPVLLIHGTADTSIPLRHSLMLAAARPAGTEVWQVAGAGHCGAMGAAPREFGRRVLARFGVAPGGSSHFLHGTNRTAVSTVYGTDGR